MTDKSTKQAGSTEGLENPDPNKGASGLDAQGQLRVGEKITIAVRGDQIVLRQAMTGREVEIAEFEFQDMLVDKYFVDHVQEGGDTL